MHKLDYDRDILTQINGFGKWQKWLFALLWLPSGFSATAVFMYSFIAYLPEDYRCRVPQCEDIDENDFQAPFINFSIPNNVENGTCYRYK